MSWFIASVDENDKNGEILQSATLYIEAVNLTGAMEIAAREYPESYLINKKTASILVTISETDEDQLFIPQNGNHAIITKGRGK